MVLLYCTELVTQNYKRPDFMGQLYYCCRSQCNQGLGGEGLTSRNAIRRVCSIIDWDIILKPRTGLEFGSQYVALVEEEDELRLGEKFGRVDHFPE